MRLPPGKPATEHEGRFLAATVAGLEQSIASLIDEQRLQYLGACVWVHKHSGCSWGQIGRLCGAHPLTKMSLRIVEMLRVQECHSFDRRQESSRKHLRTFRANKQSPNDDESKQVPYIPF